VFPWFLQNKFWVTRVWCHW